jgi:hypothetical protein
VFSTPPLRLASREPIEKAASLEAEAVPTALRLGAAAKAVAKISSAF